MNLAVKPSSLGALSGCIEERDFFYFFFGDRASERLVGGSIDGRQDQVKSRGGREQARRVVFRIYIFEMNMGKLLDFFEVLD